jgi:hypothetical protein
MARRPALPERVPSPTAHEPSQTFRQLEKDMATLTINGKAMTACGVYLVENDMNAMLAADQGASPVRRMR